MLDGLTPFAIDPDIRSAQTLPGAVYSDPRWFAAIRERVLLRSWFCIGHESELKPSSTRPITLLPGVFDEPLLLTRDEAGNLRLLSNACTHRGMLVAANAGPCRQLRCPYHGRTFGLDGGFKHMPGFEGVKGFPSPGDDLPSLPLVSWHGLLFTSLAPARPLAEILAPLEPWLRGLPIDSARLDPSAERSFPVRANFLLYLDNYLEGFHIPWVHPELVPSLDLSRYRIERHDGFSIQVGVAPPGVTALRLAAAPDEPIAGLYIQLFPTTLINVYPWGISLNFVEPLGSDQTVVRYRALVWDEGLRAQGAGSGLDRTEAQDEEVVEATQRGVRARAYGRGRYAPGHEAAVHHWHRELARLLFPAVI